MDDLPLVEDAITPEVVRTAVGMLSCRFGQPEEEASRRGRVRALLHASREFALALDRFARNAAPHTRGEHSTADMHPDADAMAHALAHWTMAVTSAAATYTACRGRGHAPATRASATVRAQSEEPPRPDL